MDVKGSGSLVPTHLSPTPEPIGSSTNELIQSDVGESCLRVVVVGAGIGGLACAIACRRATPPLQVTVIEKAPETLGIGAGIHLPPNACRVLAHFGLIDKLKQAEGYELEHFILRRYENGKPIAAKPIKARVKPVYGAEWIAIHRGDYQRVLLDEATRLGACVITDGEVTHCNSAPGSPQTVCLKDGRTIESDVVIGADGLWSTMREIVLGQPYAPEATGDLAYRGTFSRAQLEGLHNEQLDEILDKNDVSVWLGPGRHAVFYPLRNFTEYNLVLLTADDLPAGARRAKGDVEQMKALFEGWDPRLSDVISCLDQALKWKLLHCKELDQWTKGTIALLGDASHPTLPYQGQGAAMAVEDGAILGLLLDKLQATGISSDQTQKNAQLKSLLLLYESLRKKRTEINVAGAVDTRHYYHLADGDEQKNRDTELSQLTELNWEGQCSFNWGDARYQKRLLGFDVLVDAENRYNEWQEKQSKECIELGRRSASSCRF